MERWSGLGDVPVDAGPSVVAIGVFDGVHLGHRATLSRAVDAAKTRDAKAVVVTFDPHPATVVRPDAVPLLLCSLDERLERLAEAGVDATLVLPFDEELASWSPEVFVQRVLVETLHAVRVVVGANFRFGHRAAGDVELLRRLGLDVDAVDLVGELSSTAIRAMVADGDVAAAAEAMGRPFAVSGPVVRGDGRGRDLGFPTANLALIPGLAVPADGVYAGQLVRADRSSYAAAISVGTNPTFDGVARRVEAYALDVDLDLYDEVVRVEFADRLRGMVRFANVDELVAQMAEDVSTVRRTVAVPHTGTPEKAP